MRVTSFMEIRLPGLVKSFLLFSQSIFDFKVEPRCGFVGIPDHFRWNFLSIVAWTRLLKSFHISLTVANLVSMSLKSELMTEKSFLVGE